MAWRVRQLQGSAVEGGVSDFNLSTLRSWLLTLTTATSPPDRHLLQGHTRRQGQRSGPCSLHALLFLRSSAHDRTETTHVVLRSAAIRESRGPHHVSNSKRFSLSCLPELPSSGYRMFRNTERFQAAQALGVAMGCFLYAPSFPGGGEHVSVSTSLRLPPLDTRLFGLHPIPSDHTSQHTFPLGRLAGPQSMDSGY
jgi:hypothetical protein